MTHQLEADSIQLRFGNRTILSGIYLKCETGGITGLLGRNGQGKSCLMSIIYGTLSCEKSVRFDGVVHHEAFRRPDLIRYLPQFNFIPEPLSLKRVFQDWDLDFLSFTARFPEFESKYKSSIGSLSGGGRRLVELYIIVKSKSHFVMLDEPFTYLSPIQIEKVKELLLEEKGNKGLLVTDHMYRQVFEICDYMYVLSGGIARLAKNQTEIQSLGYAKI